MNPYAGEKAIGPMVDPFTRVPLATQPGTAQTASTIPAPASVSIAPTASTAPGSPQAAATQQSLDLAKYFPNLSSGISNNIAPVNYSISSQQNYPSSSFAPSTVSDALNARNSAQNGLLNGTLTGVPSTSFLQDLMGKYQTASGDYTNTAAAMNQQRLAELHAVESAYTQSGGSTAGRDAAINDINQRYGNTLSTLETTNQAANANMDAYSRFYSTFMKPSEISPGSSLITPQGQIVGQAGGASPSTIMQTAMQLWIQAQTSGTATYNSDGTPDLQPYLAQAQQYYGGGGISTYGGGGNKASASTAAAGLPPQLASALQASGGNIINEDKVPPPQRAVVQQLANQNGIPYLTAGDLDKYQSILVTKENLGNMNAVAQKILSGGLGGRTVGAAWNLISGALQLNPDISSFKAWRDTAVNTIQALAGGQGSGFRLNQAAINLAANNLPTITDNLETAQDKMTIVNSMLDRWQNQILHGNPTSLTQSSGGSSVIQTKVGAVDNSWFQ